MAFSVRGRYAKGSGPDIAYQVLGEGPIDLLLFGVGNPDRVHGR